MAIDVGRLKSIPYFAGLSPAELDSVKQFVFERAADSGEMLLLEGEPADAMYFVVSGLVKVFKTSSDGKEQILSFVRPGESFNEVSVFDGGPNLGSARAVGPVVLHVFRSKDFEAIVRSYPQVSLNVARVLSQQVRRLASLVEDLSFRHVTARVAKILLEYAGDGSGARPRLTQQEMAAMAGTAREMIGRSLRTLEDEGAIRLERHRIVIADQKALRELAQR